MARDIVHLRCCRLRVSNNRVRSEGRYRSRAGIVPSALDGKLLGAADRIDDRGDRLRHFGNESLLFWSVQPDRDSRG